MNISFGNKIPISETRIYNKKDNKFEKATLYELDAHHLSDADELVDFSIWRYAYQMSADLFSKIRDLSHYEELSDSSKHLLDHNKFYILQTQDNKLAAICETQGALNFANIHYLEQDKSKGYGLCGQAILASIAKQMLKEPGACLRVNDPVQDTRDFYTKSCGFQEQTPGSHGVEMDEERIQSFVDNFEQTVQAPIIDIEN